MLAVIENARIYIVKIFLRNQLEIAPLYIRIKLADSAGMPAFEYPPYIVTLLGVESFKGQTVEYIRHIVIVKRITLCRYRIAVTPVSYFGAYFVKLVHGL